MSDDLVKRLRNSKGWPTLGNGAADRIEELEAELAYWRADSAAAWDKCEERRLENARLETEAQLQAEEIDKTRRRADKWQSMVLDCEKYLKFGEAPAERIQREINDCLALMKLLEKKQKRIEELEAVSNDLIGIVEGIDGSMTHGTWRAEKSDLRMKDTDESDDLVNRLRDLGDRAEYAPHMHHVAADRIEELEAKLAEAVDVELIEQAISDVLSEGGTHRDAAEYVARTTLAELKGTEDAD